MIRTIIPWPHPILAQKCAPIQLWNDHLKVLVQDLTDTARGFGGDVVSLSAPQIGSPTRVIYIGKGIAGGTDMVLINPRLISSSAGYQVMAEQCPSIPGVEIMIKRYKEITIEARRPNGDDVRITVEGLMAQAVQHELNHLDGRCLPDCCNSVKRKYLAEQQLEKQHSGLTL